jgi:F-type H+-transporting ATPase subunit gamma
LAGGSIRDLRRRIRSVKNTQQITRAMKLVAASKLKRAQDTMERARPYARGMSELLVNLARRVDELSHPLTERREGGKTLLVVVSADRGLCGGFNSNLLKEAVRWLEKHPGREVCLQLVGKKGNDFFKSRSWPVRSARTDAFRRVDFAHSREIAADLVKAFTEEGFDEVLVLSNRFRTIMTQDVELQRLLPAAAPRVGAEVDESLGQVEYLYEPAPPGDARVLRVRDGRAHGGDGGRHEERLRDDRPAHARHEPQAPGGHHHRDHRDRVGRRRPRGLSSLPHAPRKPKRWQRTRSAR